MLNDNLSLVSNLQHEMYVLVPSFEDKQPGVKKGERNCSDMENSFFCDVYQILFNSLRPMQISVGTVFLDKDRMFGLSGHNLLPDTSLFISCCLFLLT